MAALLVALAVMAVLMSVAMPVWRHEAQREKEAELVFRGQQYVRAIGLFQRKTGTFPTSVDMLVQGRFLRKKYKDPITNEDFELVGAAGAPGGQPGQGGRPAAAGGRGRPARRGRGGRDARPAGSAAAAGRPVGPAAGRRRPRRRHGSRRHAGRPQQEQGRVDPAVPGPEPLQRVDVHFLSSSSPADRAGAASLAVAGGPRRPDGGRGDPSAGRSRRRAFATGAVAMARHSPVPSRGGRRPGRSRSS